MLPSRRYGSDALSGNDMITAGDFSVAMPIAEPLFERLQNLYQQLPETLCTCEHPGVCCMYLLEMTVLEALQWIRLMQAMSESKRAFKKRRRRFLRTRFNYLAKFFSFLSMVASNSDLLILP